MTEPSGKRWPLLRFLVKSLVHHFIVPTRRLLWLLAGGCPLIGLGFVFHAGFSMFWLYNALLALASVVDLSLLPRRSRIRPERGLPERADLFQPFAVALRVHNASGKPVRFVITDDIPADFERAAPIAGVAPGDASVRYETVGNKRGRYTFRTIYLRYWGGLGLWQRQMKTEAEQQIRIYPDLSAVRGILASTRNQLLLEGRKVVPLARTGSEFHTVRDHTPDDDPRMVNWRATARSGQLKTNIFRPERGKIVTLLIDCGRVMGVELDNRVKLDLVLEAALVFAAVALRQDDLVSVLAFSDKLKAYVPPDKGIAHLSRIVNAIYAIHPDPAEANYAESLDYLFRMQKKRSLTVLFSDMDNYLFADRLSPYLMRMRRSHPVLLLSLQDPVMAMRARTAARDESSAYIRSVAQQMIMARRNYAQSMGRKGIDVLDVPGDRLALSAVNRYLELKSGDRL